MSPTVLYEARDQLAVITINRPERKNAVDRDTAAGLADAFRRFEQDDRADVAVLRGAGDSFCAGADLKAISQGQPNRIAADGDGPMGPTRMLLTKPVIAAVEGHAVAGGLELAVWCDLRVAARDAVFGVFCRRWGVPLVDGGTVRLSRMIGHSRALDLILTGRGVTGQEALDMGLANRLCEPGEALSSACALAAEIARFPQICLRNDRLSSYEQWGRPLEQALQQELGHGMRTLGAPGFIEGVSAFGARPR